MEDLRNELRAGRDWMEGMLARTEAGLREVEEQLRRQDGGVGAGAAAGKGNGMAVDANGAVRLNRPGGGGGGRREKLWGLENGH